MVIHYSGVVTGKVPDLFQTRRGYSGGTAPDLHGIPYYAQWHLVAIFI
jgi:hypothetical protein